MVVGTFKLLWALTDDVDNCDSSPWLRFRTASRCRSDASIAVNRTEEPVFVVGHRSTNSSTARRWSETSLFVLRVAPPARRTAQADGQTRQHGGSI